MDFLTACAKFPGGLSLTTDAVALFLDWYATRDEGQLERVLAHPGYLTVRAHSERFGQTLMTAADFTAAAEGRPSPLYGLRGLAERTAAVRELADWIAARRAPIVTAVAAMLAPVFRPAEWAEIGLHCIVGYDMGVGLDGNVAINLNLQKYLDDPRELPYWLAHEAAHAAYERIHGQFHLRDLREPGGLRRVVCMLIHTEGFSVYTPLAARLRDGQLADRDYQALLTPDVLAAKTADLRDLVAGLQHPYPGDDALGKIFDRLSGQRLSYVVGCAIIRSIAERDGEAGVRRALTMAPGDFVAEGLALLS